MSDETLGTNRVPPMTQAVRVVSYVLASVVGLLCVATISGRLLIIEQPWLFFVVGAGMGVACSLIGPVTVRSTNQITSLPFVPYVLQFVIAAVIGAVAGMLISDVTVSPMGVFAIAIICSLFLALVHTIADANEVEDAV